MLKMRLKRVHTDAKLPTKSEGDLGWDIYVVDEITIPPKGHAVLHTGIQTAIPQGFGMILKDRSGNAAKKRLHVTAGVIDHTYRGEWLVSVENFSNVPVEINVGDRLTQAVLVRLHDLELEEVEELDTTERGDKGFGSSGA